MYYNLSLRNVKRSFKDYVIYFFTLTFSITLFYSFNSIESQQAIMQVTDSTNRVFKMAGQSLGVLSIFVAIILGLLVIYANNFLIKRRKKEFGIYITLGMSKSKISKIILIETIIIGILCLIVGLILGIFASQGLSAVTAKIFGLNLKKYTFIFSFSALLKTIVCFSVIFISISIFNVTNIKRYKLIDLIYASRKNEKLNVKNKNISVLLFLLSIIALGVAYTIILKVGILDFNIFVYISIILGILGSLLFFLSLSGFFVNFIKNNEGLYFKNLNFFIVRQIGSKINTNFISMTLICLMLFVSICIISLGIGVSNTISKELDSQIPYDAIIYNVDSKTNTLDLLNKNGMDMKPYLKDYIQYNKYLSGVSIDDIIGEKYLSTLSKSTSELLKFDLNNMDVIKISDFNKLLKMKGDSGIQLEKNGYLIYTSNDNLKNLYNKFLNDKNIVKIDNKKYTPQYNHVIYNNIDNLKQISGEGTLILPDSVCDNLKVDESILVMNLNNKFGSEQSNKIKDTFEKIKNKYNFKIDSSLETKEDLRINALGISMVMSYIGIYVGIVFLITSGAVLAIQQLSEVSDNIKRYNLLKEIGADRNMINKALFMQVTIYFMIPFILAVVHSIVGLTVSNRLIRLFGTASMINNIIFAAVFICIIYGLYFLVTFIGVKNIINKK